MFDAPQTDLHRDLVAIDEDHELVVRAFCEQSRAPRACAVRELDRAEHGGIGGVGEEAVQQGRMVALEGDVGDALVAVLQVAALRARRAVLQLAKLLLGAVLALVSAWTQTTNGENDKIRVPLSAQG